MTQRGPKPQPRALRLLQGGHPERVNQNEPIPPATDLPACPEWIKGYAREEWDRLAQDLYGMGVLTGVDTTMLAAYCMAYSRWRNAEEVLDQMAAQDGVTRGILVRTKEGNAIQNPVVGAANTARREMARLAAEFGLSPSSRTLLDSGKRGESDPVSKRYFG